MKSNVTKTNRHTHEHDFVEGKRYYTHNHVHPVDDKDILAAKKHKHVDGYHSHPHPKDHDKYGNERK